MHEDKIKKLADEAKVAIYLSRSSQDSSSVMHDLVEMLEKEINDADSRISAYWKVGDWGGANCASNRLAAYEEVLSFIHKGVTTQEGS